MHPRWHRIAVLGFGQESGQSTSNRMVSLPAGPGAGGFGGFDTWGQGSHGGRDLASAAARLLHRWAGSGEAGAGAGNDPVSDDISVSSGGLDIVTQVHLVGGMPFGRIGAAMHAGRRWVAAAWQAQAHEVLRAGVGNRISSGFDDATSSSIGGIDDPEMLGSAMVSSAYGQLLFFTRSLGPRNIETVRMVLRTQQLSAIDDLHPIAVLARAVEEQRVQRRALIALR